MFKLCKLGDRDPLTDTSLLGAAADVVGAVRDVSFFCERGAKYCSELIDFGFEDTSDEKKKQRVELVRRMLLNVLRFIGSPQHVVDALCKLDELKKTVAARAPLVDLIDKLRECRLAKRVDKWEELYWRKLSASRFEYGQEDSEAIQEAWEWGGVVKRAVIWG